MIWSFWMVTMTSSPSVLNGNCESDAIPDGMDKYIVFDVGCLYNFELAFKTIVTIRITMGIKNF